MAKKADTPKKSVRLSKSKKNQTIRERAQANANKQPRRLKTRYGRVHSRVKSGLSKTKKRVGKRLPGLPNNRFGRTVSRISKRFLVAPDFLVNAWREIRMVTWPNWRQTMRLTTAVFIFSVIFAVIVGLLDFGLDKLFKEVIIGND